MARPGPATRFLSRLFAVESDEAPAELRKRVTSPNGTTQAAIETFQTGGFEQLVGKAIRTASERGRQLSAAND